MSPATVHLMHLKIVRLPRSTLVLLLLGGCADSDGQPGFSATQSTVAGTDGASSTIDDSGTTSTGATSTGLTDGASTSTGGLTTAPTTGQNTDDTGQTEGTNGTNGTDMTGEDTAGGIGFAVHIYPILDDNCSCHEDEQGAGTLRLRMKDAYMNMVDVPSDQVPGMMRVEPGAPDMSYLWHKLNDTHLDVGGFGKKMPSGGLLKPEDLALIQMWIESGAEP